MNKILKEAIMLYESHLASSIIRARECNDKVWLATLRYKEMELDAVKSELDVS